MKIHQYTEQLKKAGRAYLQAKINANSTFENYKNARKTSTPTCKFKEITAGLAFDVAYAREQDALSALETIFNQAQHFYTFKQFIART